MAVNKKISKQSDYRIIEGILFLQGENGIRSEQLKAIFNCNKVTARQLLTDFSVWYNQERSQALTVQCFGNVFKFTTKETDAHFYKKLYQVNVKTRSLSQASMETLAIIAYKNPVTRIEVESIRGVASDSILRKLIAKELICEVGRSNTPGNPILYNVTNRFMDTFNLLNLKSLPKIPELNQTQTELNLFNHPEEN